MRGGRGEYKTIGTSVPPKKFRQKKIFILKYCPPETMVGIK
jgi:hypothetical protein